MIDLSKYSEAELEQRRKGSTPAEPLNKSATMHVPKTVEERLAEVERGLAELVRWAKDANVEALKAVDTLREQTLAAFRSREPNAKQAAPKNGVAP